MNLPYFNTPKEKMAWVLGVLSLLAIIRDFSLEILLRFSVLLTAVFIFEFIFWRVRKISVFRPTAGAISTFIIFLLADQEAPLALVVLAVATAVATKQFLRPDNKHIFNPAASGLLVASLFGLPVTWWGISWGGVPLIATILGTSYVSIFTIRQHRIVIPFILTTVIFSTLLFSNLPTALGQLMVGAFWFFTLVMLPEPQTAAHLPKTRVFYGILVGTLPFLIANLVSFGDPLLVSLLLGNLAARLVEEKIG